MSFLKNLGRLRCSVDSERFGEGSWSCEGYIEATRC